MQQKSMNLFTITFIVIFFVRQIFAQNNYVDFLSKANERLTLKILSAFSEDEDKNILFSPTSILTGIGMLYVGMDGDTRENVRKTMGFPSNPKTFRDGFQLMTKNATNPNTSPKFVANMITVNKANEIKNTFASTIKKVFNGNPYHEDFSKNPEKTRKNINAWVAKRTNKKIPELIEQGGVKSSTLVVLVNVLYFKDEWKNDPFINEPFDDTFKLGNGQDVNAKFMESDDINVGYKELNDVEIVSIPFSNNDYYMVIVAPKENSDPDTVLRKMQTDSGLTIIDSVTSPKNTLNTESVRLQMPVFKASLRKNLVEILDSIGLSAILEPEANYDRLSEARVKVDAINHMAVIDVNTNGVEAAAATAISIATKLGIFKADKVIKIDQPFLYFIVEDSKKIVHFAGILRDPNEAVEGN